MDPLEQKTKDESVQESELDPQGSVVEREFPAEAEDEAPETQAKVEEPTLDTLKAQLEATKGELEKKDRQLELEKKKASKFQSSASLLANDKKHFMQLVKEQQDRIQALQSLQIDETNLDLVATKKAEIMRANEVMQDLEAKEFKTHSEQLIRNRVGDVLDDEPFRKQVALYAKEKGATDAQIEEFMKDPYNGDSVVIGTLVDSVKLRQENEELKSKKVIDSKVKQKEAEKRLSDKSMLGNSSSGTESGKFKTSDFYDPNNKMTADEVEKLILEGRVT